MDIQPPQSIVHQMIRGGQMIMRHSNRTRRKLRRSRKGAEGGDDSSCASSCYNTDSFYSTASFGSASGKGLPKKQDDIVHKSTTSGDSDDEVNTVDMTDQEASPVMHPKQIKNLTVDIPKLVFGTYRTINQNEFFIECMINGEGVSSVIHFFNSDSRVSQELDVVLEEMAKKYKGCKFLRIDGAWTQFVSAKLMIDQFPTVIAIRDKVVLNRLTPLAISAEVMDKWLVQSVPMVGGN